MVAGAGGVRCVYVVVLLKAHASLSKCAPVDPGDTMGTTKTTHLLHREQSEICWSDMSLLQSHGLSPERIRVQHV